MLRPFRFVLLALLLVVPAVAGVAGNSRPERDGPSQAERPVAVDTIRVDGSNGVMPLAAALAEAFQREHPSVALVFGKGLGSGARLAALRERRIDIALASHGLDTAALRRDGFVPHRVATTAVVFGVNAAVPVRNISARQVCGIFVGADSTWGAMAAGTESIAMTVVAREESEVDMEVLRREVPCLGKTPMSARVRIAADTEEMRRALLESRGAIGVTTATIVQQERGRLRALALDGVAPTNGEVAAGRYRLVRDSYFVASASPSPAVTRLLAWLRTAAAVRVLEANGAVSAR